MAYVIGTDEAGYGPNLGPLVITATLWEVADGTSDEDLYQRLRRAVCVEPDDAGPRRVAWADSKALYTPARGLANLERGALAALTLAGVDTASWRTLWDSLEAGCPIQRDALPWNSDSDFTLPAVLEESLDKLLVALRDAFAKAEVRLARIVSRAVFASEFNQLVEYHGNKATALSHLTLQLVAKLLESVNTPLVFIRCDKHGGRNRYAALLQHIFPDTLVTVHGERRDESHYSLSDGARHCEARFCVESERFMPVAVASMVSKYVRELSMRPFNNFWCTRVAQLRPTAGYPSDSRRFKREIAATQAALGISDEILWRNR